MRNKELFLEYWAKLKTLPEFNTIVQVVKSSDYLRAPASVKYHSNYDSGLVDHSTNVVFNLVNLTERLDIKWDRPESPYIIGLFHDWCKVDFYKKAKAWRKDDKGKWEQYDSYEIDNKDPLGHGTKSVILLQKFIKLTDQEIYCIMYHMHVYGLNNEQTKDFNQAIKMYPEILYVCLADQLAGIQEEEGIYGGIKYEQE